MYCWIDGEILKASDLKITPFDYGFMYGYNVFETFRTYKGKVVLFQEHFNRLIESLMYFQMKMPYSINQLEEGIEQITKLDGIDATVHLIVSAGENFYNKSYYKPKVLILRSVLRKRKEKEVKLNWSRCPLENNPVGDFYGRRIFIPFEQNEKRIYYTTKEIIRTGIYSTIFWVKNDILYTPRIDDDDYCDITRKWVIITARALGYKVIEDIFIRNELEEAYECFITNAIDGIVPVSQVGSYKFLGKDGPIYNQIHHAYLDEIFQLIQGEKGNVR